ncbi:hypothetical protein SprV_0602074300 [Sparganum proliferum]
MEEENNRVLAFLDVQVSRQEDGTLQTGVFRKVTDTEKILHYNSNHPLSHKRSCVRTLFHRIHTHCSREAEKLRERKILWRLFLANGYPRSFVNKCSYRKHTKTDGEKKQKPEISRVLPYVSNVSEATERMLRPLGVGVGHRPEATIRRLIMQSQDRLPLADTSGVIYRVKCLDCLANYCGMTDKRLRTRIHEHTLVVRRKEVRSHVTTHCLEDNHRFDFDATQVLGRAESKLASEVIEAWKSDTNSINRIFLLKLTNFMEDDYPLLIGGNPKGMLQGRTIRFPKEVYAHFRGQHRPHMQPVTVPMMLGEIHNNIKGYINAFKLWSFLRSDQIGTETTRPMKRLHQSEDPDQSSPKTDRKTLTTSSLSKRRKQVTCVLAKQKLGVERISALKKSVDEFRGTQSESYSSISFYDEDGHDWELDSLESWNIKTRPVLRTRLDAPTKTSGPAAPTSRSLGGLSNRRGQDGVEEGPVVHLPLRSVFSAPEAVRLRYLTRPSGR